MSISVDFGEFYGKQIRILGLTYDIDSTGEVTVDGKHKLGHLEDCFEEGLTILKLLELMDQIELHPPPLDASPADTS